MAAALPALALAVGGAGPAFPLLEMLVELGAVAALFYFACRRQQLAPAGAVPLVLLGLILLLPLLQLVPLPPHIWTRLPGRELATQIGVAAGLAGEWRPVSLDPEATWHAFLALLPGAAMFVAMLHLAMPQRIRLLWLVLAFALAGALLGALQAASGDGSGVTPFRSSHTGYAVGLFVNRNHQACFLLVAMILAAGASVASNESRTWGTARPHSRLIALGFILLLGLGTIVTTSRMGTALLPVALLISLLILFHDRVGWKLAAGIAFGLVVCLVVASQSGVVGRTLGRFADLDDARFVYWQNVQWAIGQYRWSGSGFGSFFPVYQVAESLSSVEPTLPRNAHNDFLEVALEGGLPALLLLVSFILFGLCAAWRLLKSPLPERALGLAGLGVVAIVLLYSIVDYPLRRLAIETIFAAAAGLLVSPPGQRSAVRVRGGARGPSLARKFLFGLAIMSAGLFAWQIAAAALSRHLMAAGRGEAASRWAPWSSRAFAQLGEKHLAAGRDPEAAATAARAALAISPIDVGAVRTLGWAADVRGDHVRALALLGAAGELGWRDTLTQLWLIQLSLTLNEPTVVMQRADALMRRGVVREPIMALLERLERSEPMNAALAVQIAQNPNWRTNYLTRASMLRPDAYRAREALLLRLVAAGSPPRVVEARGFVAKLAEAGDYARAYRIWRKVGGQWPLHNGGFESDLALRSSDAAPFEWRAPGLLGVKLTVAQPDMPLDGMALRIDSEGVSTGPLLVQSLMLSPGSYRLSALLREDSPGAVAAQEWSLGCAADEAATRRLDMTRTSAGPSGWIRLEAPFGVPNNQCAVQQLQLRLTRGGGAPSAVWMDEVAIDAGRKRLNKPL